MAIGYWINNEPYRNKICKVFIFYRIAIFAVANEKFKDNIIRDHTFCFRILCNKIWYAVRERRSFTGFGQWQYAVRCYRPGDSDR